MKNFKSKTTGIVYKNTGTFVDNDGETCYLTCEFSGLTRKGIEFTNEKEWIDIVINLVFTREERLEYYNFFITLGGTADKYNLDGYQYFIGSKEMITKLLKHIRIDSDIWQSEVKRTIEDMKENRIIQIH